MFQLSTDGILQYEAHRLCYVFSNVPVNQLYDRYNAAQDVQYCVKYRCKTLSVAPVERLSQFVEGVLILRSKSLKYKIVVDNTILLKYCISSENISTRIKTKTENDFHFKQNVCVFCRNESCPEKQLYRRQLFESGFFQFFFCSEAFV